MHNYSSYALKCYRASRLASQARDASATAILAGLAARHVNNAQSRGQGISKNLIGTVTDNEADVWSDTLGDFGEKHGSTLMYGTVTPDKVHMIQPYLDAVEAEDLTNKIANC